jgi:DNA-binding Xre family transcriptional regulator
MEFSDLIALKIKELMDQQGITIYKLQDLSGVYNSTIDMFLTRKTKTIRLENLLYICDALHISLSEFFADERFETAEAKDWHRKKKEK